MEQTLTEEDRLLEALEHAATQARLALHAVQDSRRYVIGECGDTDGDGDCPRCLTRTGSSEAKRWKCPRVAEAQRSDAMDALLGAVEEARGHAGALCMQLNPARYGGGWDGNG